MDFLSSLFSLGSGMKPHASSSAAQNASRMSDIPRLKAVQDAKVVTLGYPTLSATFAILNRWCCNGRVEVLDALVEVVEERFFQIRARWKLPEVNTPQELLKRIVNQRSPERSTHLILAVQAGQANVVRKLIQLGADRMATDRRGFNALHHACTEAKPQMVTAVMECRHPSQLDSDLIDMPDSFGATPLLLAVATRDAQTVAAVLVHSPDINKRSVRYTCIECTTRNEFTGIPARSTPLTLAIRFGGNQMVQALLTFYASKRDAMNISDPRVARISGQPACHIAGMYLDKHTAELCNPNTDLHKALRRVEKLGPPHLSMLTATVLRQALMDSLSSAAKSSEGGSKEQGEISAARSTEECSNEQGGMSAAVGGSEECSDSSSSLHKAGNSVDAGLMLSSGQGPASLDRPPLTQMRPLEGVCTGSQHASGPESVPSVPTCTCHHRPLSGKLARCRACLDAEILQVSAIIDGVFDEEEEREQLLSRAEHARSGLGAHNMLAPLAPESQNSQATNTPRGHQGEACHSQGDPDELAREGVEEEEGVGLEEVVPPIARRENSALKCSRTMLQEGHAEVCVSCRACDCSTSDSRDSDSDEDECGICLEYDAHIVIQCGSKGKCTVCSRCAEQMCRRMAKTPLLCPFCRSPVRGFSAVVRPQSATNEIMKAS